MLQELRTHAQGWIAGVIVGILCLAFALFGVQYYIGNSSKQPAVAKVNGDEITQAQLDSAYQRLRQSLNATNVTDPAVQQQLKNRALNGLIQERVLAHAATDAGYTISQAQVGAMLQQIPVFQVNGQFSVAAFQRILQSLSYTVDGFIQDISKQSLIGQVQRGFTESEFVLPNEVDQRIVLDGQQRDFGYFVIPATPSATSPTTDEITAYYKQHSADFLTPEQFSLQYVVLSRDDVDKNVTVSGQEVRDYYQNNQLAFTVQGKVTPFDKVQAQIEKNIRQQKNDKLISDQSDQLVNLTYTQPNTLKPAAEALGLTIQTTPLFTREGSKTGFVANPKILAAALSDNVLKQGNNSDVISLDDRTLAVIRIAEHKPATVQPLTTVQPTIITILKRQTAEQAAAELGAKVQQQLQQGTAPTQVATQNKLPWVQKTAISRQSTNIPAAVLQLAFNQPAPSDKQKVSVRGGRLANGDYAVVAVSKVQDGVLTAADNKQKMVLAKQAVDALAAWDYDLYLMHQTNQAKIKQYSNAAKTDS